MTRYIDADEIIKYFTVYGDEEWTSSELEGLLNNALTIDAVEVVRCENCKYQDECEEIVLFDINDDEVMGHRVHWCSYGRRE